MSINFLYVSNELNTFSIHRCSSGVVLAVESMSVTVNLYTCMCDVGPFKLTHERGKRSQENFDTSAVWLASRSHPSIEVCDLYSHLLSQT